MANLSNINNKLIVTDGGNLLVNSTANLTTYGGITIDNFSDPSIAMKTTGTSGWLWTQYITSTGTNNFSMGVNQTTPYWCVKAGAGMDSPHLVVDAAGKVGIGTTFPGYLLNVVNDDTATWTARFTNNTNNVYLSVNDANNYGIYVSGESKNYFSNKVGIGTIQPEANLQVNRNTSTANLFNFLDVVANFGNQNSNPGNHYPSGIRIYQGSGTMGSGLAALNIGVDTNSAVAESQNTATIETPNGMTQGLRLSTRDSSAPIRFNTDSTQRMRIDSGGSIIIGAGATSGTPTADYRSLEIGRQGNTITGAPWKSNLYFSTNATITAGSTTFTYRYASELPTKMVMEDGMFTFANAVAGTVGSAISFTERMRIHEGGSITMGKFNSTNAPNNGILKIKTNLSTANVCYPLLSIMGSTHLATRQYGIGMDPEGYSNRLKMFFGVDGMGNGYSFGDFVWNINTQVSNDIVSPSDERMRLDKAGDLKLKTGSLFITDTSKGIYLGGTGSSNKLDFYQSGSWTPSVTSSGGGGFPAYSSIGYFQRIGKVVTVSFEFTISNLGTASGTVIINNLPVAIANGNGIKTVVGYGNIPTLGQSLSIYHYTALNQIGMNKYDGTFAGTTYTTRGTVTYWAEL